MEDSTWIALCRREDLLHPVRVLIDFTVNIDLITLVTRNLLELLLADGRGPGGLRGRWYHAMETCTTDEMFVHDAERYRQFAGMFTGNGAIGGQAGIAEISLAYRMVFP
jgi:hypothetical protein